MWRNWLWTLRRCGCGVRWEGGWRSRWCRYSDIQFTSFASPEGRQRPEHSSFLLFWLKCKYNLVGNCPFTGFYNTQIEEQECIHLCASGAVLWLVKMYKIENLKKKRTNYLKEALDKSPTLGGGIFPGEDLAAGTYREIGRQIPFWVSSHSSNLIIALFLLSLIQFMIEI